MGPSAVIKNKSLLQYEGSWEQMFVKLDLKNFKVNQSDCLDNKYGSSKKMKKS